MSKPYNIDEDPGFLSYLRDKEQELPNFQEKYFSYENLMALRPNTFVKKIIGFIGNIKIIEQVKLAGDVSKLLKFDLCNRDNKKVEVLLWNNWMESIKPSELLKPYQIVTLERVVIRERTGADGRLFKQLHFIPESGIIFSNVQQPPM